MARAAATLALLLGCWAAAAQAAPAEVASSSTPAAAGTGSCPDACVCFYDARLWISFPREDSLSARCSRRGLETLPRGLSAAVDLRHLDLSGNELDTLHEAEFASRGVDQLLSLDLSDNFIVDVHPGAFEGLRSLGRLVLTRNRIATLPEDVFADCVQLWFLSLAGNPLVVPDSASGKALITLPSLKVLDISGIKLNFFPDHVLGENNALQELIAANNTITDVSVKKLKSLRRLNLSDNSLRSVAGDALNAVGNLRTLMLNGNPLRPGADGKYSLPRSASLRVLAVARCGLRRVDPSMFEELPNIEELALDGNGIVDIPVEAFSAIPRLRRLNLSNNRLQTLPPALFADNTDLRALDLSGNPLRLVPALEAQPTTLATANPSWLTVPTLRELGLSRCWLRALPASLFAGIPALRDLSATDNALRWLGADVVAALPELRSLDLRGNPLRCNAALRPAWLACNAQNVRVAAACFDPPGDWDLLRHLANSGGDSGRLLATTPASHNDDDDDEEEEDDNLKEELIEYVIRWGPVLGVFVLVIATVFLLRKWIIYMSFKRYRFQARSKEYVYESDEDATTTTMITEAGSPRLSPTSPQDLATRFALPPSSPPPPSPPVGESPAAAKRLAAAGNIHPAPSLPRFTITPTATPFLLPLAAPPVRNSRM